MGSSGVLTAGEPERAYRAKRLVDGITVDETTWAELIAAGEKVDVTI
jgi:uncharacterized oxidoreductase